MAVESVFSENKLSQTVPLFPKPSVSIFQREGPKAPPPHHSAAGRGLHDCHDAGSGRFRQGRPCVDNRLKVRIVRKRVGLRVGRYWKCRNPRVFLGLFGSYPGS